MDTNLWHEKITAAVFSGTALIWIAIVMERSLANGG